MNSREVLLLVVSPIILYSRCLQYITAIRQTVFEHLKQLRAAPSVQMHDVPPDLLDLDTVCAIRDDADADANVDEREVASGEFHPGEFYRDEHDHDENMP